jgi:hypothetical protein
MIQRVISGGQTGADQAGWRAARAAGIVTGGWMPKGFLTEDGPRPEFAELYGAQEHHLIGYPPRTKANVRDSDGTMIFNVGSEFSMGTKATLRACRYGDHPTRPALIVGIRHDFHFCTVEPDGAADWIDRLFIKTLNVAGNRESVEPGIGAWVERYLTEVFRLIRDGSPA